MPDRRLGARFPGYDVLMIAVPHECCIRAPDYLSWPGEYVERAIDLAAGRGDVLIAIHSHPGGFNAFSELDDASDRILMGALRHGTDRIAGSAIMIPGGAIRARLYETDLAASPVDLVMNVGTDIRLWWNEGATAAGPLPPAMAFTSDMRARLALMSICIIGVSGTGSIVAEQLARLGLGEIILIDFDKLEDRNLNRILNSTLADIDTHKVEMFAAAVRRYRPDCDVIPIVSSISARDAVLAACETDALFS